MIKHTTIGIDLAKSVFQIAILNGNQKLISNRSYSRQKLCEFMANHPPCTVGLEACGSAHYWARTFTEMGHQVKVIPAAYVKGFVYGNKHDANDAKACALAAAQSEAPTVGIKNADQLALQALLRVRQRHITNRTQCANQIRGLLAEHGLVIHQGLKHIDQLRPGGVPAPIRPIMEDLLAEFNTLDALACQSHQQVRQTVKVHPLGERLLGIPGFGVVNALAALVVNPADFRHGRHYAAYLGLVPKLSGTGGKITIRGLSKRGNRYHRKLLCDGARAFLNRCKDPQDPLWRWATGIALAKGHNVAVAALANKLARISWQVLNGQTYDVNKAVKRMNQ